MNDEYLINSVKRYIYLKQTAVIKILKCDMKFMNFTFRMHVG